MRMPRAAPPCRAVSAFDQRAVGRLPDERQLAVAQPRSVRGADLFEERMAQHGQHGLRNGIDLFFNAFPRAKQHPALRCRDTADDGLVGVEGTSTMSIRTSARSTSGRSRSAAICVTVREAIDGVRPAAIVALRDDSHCRYAASRCAEPPPSPSLAMRSSRRRPNEAPASSVSACGSHQTTR